MKLEREKRLAWVITGNIRRLGAGHKPSLVIFFAHFIIPYLKTVYTYRYSVRVQVQCTLTGTVYTYRYSVDVHVQCTRTLHFGKGY